MDLGILNTIIAVVIVLLVLSLLVQSVQGFIKKLLKLKSRQILQSLEDLYEQALSNSPAAQAEGNTPPAATSSPSAKAFTDNILAEFAKIGRVTRRGVPILDSISKDDLLKIMAKLESEGLVPNYGALFQEVVNDLATLRTTIETLAANPQLQGEASAQLASIRGLLAPVYNDVRGIIDQDNKVRSKVIFGDLLRLGKLNLSGIPQLLNVAQQAITDEISAALQSNPPQPVAELQTASTELVKIANLLGNLTQKFDNAVAPLRIKLEQVETWYDTVMQGFDERYARHMKSVAIYISIVVVILLNANFFKVYRSLSTNSVQRNLLVQNGQKVLDEAKRANQTPSPTPATTPVPAAAAGAAKLQEPSVNPTPTPSPTPTPDIKKEAEETKQNIDLYVNMYEEFGFSPLSGEQVNYWVWSTGIWTLPWAGDGGGGWGFTIARNDKGIPVNAAAEPIARDCHERGNDGKVIMVNGKPVDCSPRWRPMSGSEWWASRKHDVSVLFGWAIMVLLLSVGAPFWQDTLESLFGVKNLLRQKSATQNVEQQSGAGAKQG